MFSKIGSGRLLAITAAVASLGYVAQQRFSASAAESKTEHGGLSSKDFLELKLVKKTRYNHNTEVFSFALPDASAPLELPVASYVLCKAAVDGKEVIRPYTPIHQDEAGVLTLLVKEYESGNLSRYFGTLKEGDRLAIKGPMKKIEWSTNFKKEVGMVAGGSGITPMLQIMNRIFSDPKDTTKVTLVFANVTPKDILLREEIDALQRKVSLKFTLVS